MRVIVTGVKREKYQKDGQTVDSCSVHLIEGRVGPGMAAGGFTGLPVREYRVTKALADIVAERGGFQVWDVEVGCERQYGEDRAYIGEVEHKGGLGDFEFVDGCLREKKKVGNGAHGGARAAAAVAVMLALVFGVQCARAQAPGTIQLSAGQSPLGRAVTLTYVSNTGYGGAGYVSDPGFSGANFDNYGTSGGVIGIIDVASYNGELAPYGDSAGSGVTYGLDVIDGSGLQSLYGLAGSPGGTMTPVEFPVGGASVSNGWSSLGTAPSLQTGALPGPSTESVLPFLLSSAAYCRRLRPSS